MSDLIYSGSDSYSRYEELLLRKNDLKKECFQLEQEYIRVFGEEIMANFKLQLECARKVKTIEFCLQYINRGLEPDNDALQEYVRKETQELADHLQQMTKEYEESQNTGTVTQSELMEIRQIYRRIVKKIHPDIHPELQNSEALADLWNQVTAAYNCNQLEDLKELEVLVTSALAELSGDSFTLKIENIDEKIEKLQNEIRDIMSKDPYQYKFLLNDPEKVRTAKQALAEQKKNYLQYSAELDEKLNSILPPGTFIIWED